MFLLDKLKIRTLNFFHSFFYHLLFWLASLALYVFITGDESTFINYFKLFAKDDIYGNTVLLGSMLAVLFTSFDMLFSDKLMRFSPIRIIVLLRFLFYLLLALLVIFLSANASIKLEQLKDYQIYYRQMPELTIEHIRFVVWFYISCILFLLIHLFPFHFHILLLILLFSQCLSGVLLKAVLPWRASWPAASTSA